jgi:putative tributyrin esterase
MVDLHAHRRVRAVLRSARLMMLALAALAALAAHAALASPALAQRASSSASLHGTVRGDIVVSAALGITKHFFVYLPPSYESSPRRRYPVAYYLHGLGGHESDWLSAGGLDDVADSLIAAGMPEAIIVMPDGDDGWYSSWVAAPAYQTCLDSLLREAPARACVPHARYDEYIAHDVVARVDARYRTIADRAHRGIGGLSMGGYGAMKLALAYPETFAAAASHSGTLSLTLLGRGTPPAYARSADTLLHGFFERNGPRLYGRDLAVWRANDPTTLAERVLAARRPMPALFFDCGTEDGLLAQNRAFDVELTRLGVAHAYHEHPGAHTWRYWNTHLRESLPWMLGVIGREH